MKRRNVGAAFALACLVLAAGPASGQGGSLIERELGAARRGSPWRLGSLWLSPLFVFESGYDSNGLSSARRPVEDFVARQTTAMGAAVPLGTRAMARFHGQVNVTYYNELTILRDAFHTLRGDVIWGGKKLLFDAGGGQRIERVRPNSARDVLADQTVTELGGAATLAIGGRHEASVDYRNQRFRLQDLVGTPVVEIPLEGQLDRDEDLFRARLTRRITGDASFVAEGEVKLIDFTNETNEGDANVYGVVGGMTFSPTGTLQGRSFLGYKRIVPGRPGPPEFQGLVGAVGLVVRLAPSYGVRARFSRDAEPSFFLNNRFIVETSAGASALFFWTPTTTVEVGASLGRNGYRLPSRFVDRDGILGFGDVEDDRTVAFLELTHDLNAPWSITVEASYTKRTSNVLLLNKDRFVANVRFASSF